MLSLGSLAFAAPWLLAAFAVLPILWWLLRVTPPAPRRVRFPALRLLMDLVPREETPAKTPLWLILLRMALAALVILALAHPLLNPSAKLAGNGPLVLVVDNGWSGARQWDERRAALGRFIDQAERENRRIILLATADPAPPSLLRPSDARAAVDAMAPEPWPADRKGALAALTHFDLGSAPDLVWLSDGVDDGAAADFAAGLAKYGPLRVLTDTGAALPRLLAPGDPDDKDLTAVVKRADASEPA
ncbi:MAG TPA: BatA domain-containing protein, partial [Stellaceae bacterium]|nr:BatA domain-containing protein [Stellaceae bacterium]